MTTHTITINLKDYGELIGEDYSFGSATINITLKEYKHLLNLKNQKEENIKHKEKENQFLSKLVLTERCIYGESWVTKLMSYVYHNTKVHASSGRFKTDKSKLIDERYIIEMCEKQKRLSYFLKIPLDFTMSNPLKAPSLDRIDNNKGYEKGNVNLVTRFENLGRGAATIEEFNSLCSELNQSF